MVVDRNFGSSKITVVDRNFGPSKITIVDRNFGPSKITIKGTQPRGLRIPSELPLGASVCTSCLALGFRIGTS